MGLVKWRPMSYLVSNKPSTPLLASLRVLVFVLTMASRRARRVTTRSVTRSFSIALMLSGSSRLTACDRGYLGVMPYRAQC